MPKRRGKRKKLSKKARQRRREAWAKAGEVCGLSEKQIETARALKLRPKEAIARHRNPDEPSAAEWIAETRQAYLEKMKRRGAAQRERRAKRRQKELDEQWERGARIVWQQAVGADYLWAIGEVPIFDEDAFDETPDLFGPEADPEWDGEKVAEGDPFGDPDGPFEATSDAAWDRYPREADTRAPANEDHPLDETDDPFVSDDDEDWGPVSSRQRAEVQAKAEREDCRSLERHQRFREAAEWVARAMGDLLAVQKVVLFGSVAQPPTREESRFRKYRREGIEPWHHCKDIDLAVWVDDLACLADLQRVRNTEVTRFYDDTGFGVANHQFDVFIMEPGTDRYLGRLCQYKVCPREDKRLECYGERGCANTVKHLKRHPDFVFRPEALAPEQSVVLFERGGDSGGAGCGASDRQAASSQGSE